MKAVFYAWQSELPGAMNRSFIESCLERAIARVNQRRPPGAQLFLDQDTRGVSGMPDVSEVIFDKIDTCAVFVPDMSLTLRGPSGRTSPNANVLLELGYALRAIGDRRIVGVFNEATGSIEELPFDLRRHRWPARYALTEASSTEERQRCKEGLVTELTKRIAAAAARADADERGDGVSSEASPASLEAHGRFKSGEIIAHVDASVPGVESTGKVVWANRAQATIELRPKTEKATESFRALRQMAAQSSFALSAFGPRQAQWFSQNRHGYLAGDVVSNPTQPRAICITQLYKHSGMLYGVNQALVAEAEGRQMLLADQVREQFQTTLQNYLSFYRVNPGLGESLNLYVTLEYMNGVWLREGSVAQGRDLGRIVENYVYHSQESITSEANVSDVLRPLFVKLWDNAGVAYEDSVLS